MRFSSALISFLSSLSTTSVSMAMEEPHDSVLHDVTASILEESIEVKYKNKKSHLEPLKIQNSIDGRPNKANDVDLADDKDDIMQKKEIIHHLIDFGHLNRGTCSSPNDACVPQNKAIEGNGAFFEPEDASYASKSIEKMDYGHLNRGTCSSPNDACVPQHKAIEGNSAFSEPEDASYASSGYCVPLYVLEGIKYKNGVTTTMSIIDMEKFNKEEEMTDSYYQDHPQYDHNHRQLDSLDCTSECSGVRPDISNYLDDLPVEPDRPVKPDEPLDVLSYINNDASSFRNLISNCYNGDNCPPDYDDIGCWNTTGITDMTRAFLASSFNAPLECWDVGKVTSMYRMFQDTTSFNQHIDSWNVSQVETIDNMFLRATSFNQPIDSWDVSQVTGMQSMFRYTSFDQSIDSWDVSQVTSMQSMFRATNFNQCLSTWAEKTSDTVSTASMLAATDCPNGIGSPNKTIGPWCQNFTQGCFAPNCKSKCPDQRLYVLSYINNDASSFRNLISNCYNGDNCPSDDDDIGCWNTTGITDMTLDSDTGMARMFQYATSFNQPIDSWDVSQHLSFNQPVDSWDVSQVVTMRLMFSNAFDFNQCLSTWAGKTSDTVSTTYMLFATDCPNGIGSPNANIGPWCQNYTQGCIAPGFKPLRQPSDLPSNKPTDVPTKPPTTSPTDSPTTKSQKKKSIKKTKKQVKKKSKKM
ncbi:hypothetical protein FRACYDRAFT_238401 [Fragilariopsis cylindrus CCMP1102]|uniref:DUF285-domain-containing protein n=1 Tax=Fragilariopsis cylindrus CCMP1102 TaxID=635003 RepID=A0A1E7FIG5_9STRA|nr:hypothetical protein FRACYDRAFT_238401 [Fragilariopsis cylindrus CCMP1102]|eukprot:OEU17970.1 hypothetical protein FRACYDRAFT_238401 [Fragilariopsis cylindrus CCMP1102]